MLLILPLAAYGLIFRFRYRESLDWRSAAIEAATFWAVFLALATELLSVLHLVTRLGVAAAWAALCAACLVHARFSKASGKTAEEPAPGSRLERADRWLLAGAGLIVLLVGITGLFSPPNTWDAVSYHMSRVTQWSTNHDIFFYPTFYSAQLFLAPWAEYTILHLDLLFGGDRVAFLVEWLSFGGLIVGVSLLARELGANRRGQVVAAIACATIPEVILEASGAMNTCAGAFWVVTAVYFALRARKGADWPTLLGAAAATGLAIFTKGTALAFLPPLLLASWWMASPVSRKRMLTRLPAMIAIVLLLNGPLFVRNYRLSGSPLGFPSPLGDDPQRQYANSRISASVAVANTIKNLALHVGTPSDTWNARLQGVIDGLLRKSGIDPDDPTSTYRGGFHVNRTAFHESTAGNPLQLLLAAIACLLLLLQGRRVERRTALYAAATVGAFVLFCAVFRWQMWNSRYHLPVFALGCAFIGTVLGKHWSRRATASACGLLLLTGLPFCLLNTLRPLAPWRQDSILRRPRQDFYFTDFHTSSRNAYLATAREVQKSSCQSIGVDGSLQDFDYPLLAMISDQDGRKVQYTGVTNRTAAYRRSQDQEPCVVVCLRCADAPAKWAQYRKIGGRATVHGDNVVFSSAGESPNVRTPEDGEWGIPTPVLVETMKREVETLRAADLTPLANAVYRATKQFPDKSEDLLARLDGLYMERVDCWRVEHSPDPMRRAGERIDGPGLDPAQALAAEETLRSWIQELPHKVAELEGLAEHPADLSYKSSLSEAK